MYWEKTTEVILEKAVVACVRRLRGRLEGFVAAENIYVPEGGVVWLVWCGWCGVVGLVWCGWCGVVGLVWFVWCGVVWLVDVVGGCGWCGMLGGMWLV